QKDYNTFPKINDPKSHKTGVLLGKKVVVTRWEKYNNGTVVEICHFYDPWKASSTSALEIFVIWVTVAYCSFLMCLRERIIFQDYKELILFENYI
uniref:Uncharacterized protein n=1 Tax=Romanomermis culicivorax TaxID=13658 RepID=A0A915J0J3_ROMCU